MIDDTVRLLGELRADPSLAMLGPSLDYYYGDADRAAAMDRFYRRFVRPGNLVFDVGAHVGDRIASFLRLGARVVAVEPQPPCVRALRALYGHDQVEIVEAACSDRTGHAALHVNSGNPTVSTISERFVRAADGAGGWERQTWDAEVSVRTVTLDALIGQFGEPSFIKIDVEGFEDAVLAGLGRAVPAVSFEFTTIARGVAARCLDRLAELGFTGFDLSLAETMALGLGRWVTAGQMRDHLAGLPHEANAGDVYAVTVSVNSMRAFTRQ
ncbi:FkbM family methyltransferase [Actinoplanes sp. NPDC049596]|uniref:FkbM family methyltransferase n=1 Tax=unclassified Actinoplanes TaxID=2626549 RepID=UPI00343FA852